MHFNSSLAGHLHRVGAEGNVGGVVDIVDRVDEARVFTDVHSAAKPQPKVEGEACSRECWQDLARRDAERQRRRGKRG